MRTCLDNLYQRQKILCLLEQSLPQISTDQMEGLDFSVRHNGNHVDCALYRRPHLGLRRCAADVYSHFYQRPMVDRCITSGSEKKIAIQTGDRGFLCLDVLRKLEL